MPPKLLLSLHLQCSSELPYLQCVKNIEKIYSNDELGHITSSITVLRVNKARVKNSQFFSLSCLSRPSGHWPVLAALRGKSGLRYAHVFLFNTVMLDVGWAKAVGLSQGELGWWGSQFWRCYQHVFCMAQLNRIINNKVAFSRLQWRILKVNGFITP